MSIEEADIVDFLSVGHGGTEAELTISDHLDWTDEDRHLELLQAKVYRYLDFIDSGEIYERYPEARGCRLRIRIRAETPLPPRALSLVQNLAEVASSQRVAVDVHPSPAS
jgi:hypothetical protein